MDGSFQSVPEFDLRMLEPAREGKLPARLEYRDWVNPQRSLVEGRPIKEKRAHITIFVPGGRDTVDQWWDDCSADRKRLYQKEYEALMAGKPDFVDGTPLTDWSALSFEELQLLNWLKIFTVEQLAEASDTVKSRIGMGAGEMVAKAKAFLAIAKDQAAAQRFVVEAERLKMELEVRDQTILEQRERLEALERTVGDLEKKYGSRRKEN